MYEDERDVVPPSPRGGGARVTAADGRVLGTRALRTRQRVLDATLKLLRERGVLDLRVIDVTRSIGLSPATFYQYFAGVEDAILALAEQASEEVESMRPIVTEDWDGAPGMDHARELVSAFMEYRDRNQTLLRLRDLKATENDRRFRALRRRSYAGLIGDLMAKIEAAKAAGRIPAEHDAFTAACGVMAMLEQLGAYQAELRRRSPSREAMIDTVAAMVLHALTGRT